MAAFVEIKLAKFNFRFRPLTWREEFALETQAHTDPRIPILSKALVEVSGLKVSLAEAEKVISALPLAIRARAYILYRGGLPPDKKFLTVNLYAAPSPSSYASRVVEDDTAIESEVDKVEKQLIRTFGRQEVEEVREVEKAIVSGSKKDGRYRGAVRKELNE